MSSSPSTTKFRIGDRVTVNRPGGPYYGRRGVVVELDPIVRVRLDGWEDQYSFGVDESDLKLEVLDTLASL